MISRNPWAGGACEHAPYRAASWGRSGGLQVAGHSASRLEGGARPRASLREKWVERALFGAERPRTFARAGVARMRLPGAGRRIALRQG